MLQLIFDRSVDVSHCVSSCIRQFSVFVDAPIAVSLCVVVNILAVSVGVSVDG